MTTRGYFVVIRALELILLKSKKSILLLGPRQTGKSTLLKRLKPDLMINLSSESEFLKYSSDPELFESVILGKNYKTVFIDEIQRLPNLLNSIQAIVDDVKIKFYLSGSSARKLRRGHANLLPGRIFTYTLGGLTAKELNYKMDLKRALTVGVLPEPYLEKDKATAVKLLESYSATYLKEEIQAEALVRNIQGFARFLNAMANVSGKILDFSKVATKAKVSRTNVVRFVEILEDTLVAYRVPIFEETLTADTIKHSKIYFFDVGVLNGLLGNFTVSDDRIGSLFEHFIFNQIKNSISASDEKAEIYFFRTRSGVEVDFIIKLKGKVWAIEVKAGSIAKSDLGGLKAFREYYPEVHRCIAVSPKEIFRELDQILICDWVTLLKELGL